MTTFCLAFHESYLSTHIQQNNLLFSISLRSKLIEYLLSSRDKYCLPKVSNTQHFLELVIKSFKAFFNEIKDDSQNREALHIFL